MYTVIESMNQLTVEEWEEMRALKEAINANPATVHPDKMERFTELFVKTLPKINSDEIIESEI